MATAPERAEGRKAPDTAHRPPTCGEAVSARRAPQLLLGWGYALNKERVSFTGQRIIWLEACFVSGFESEQGFMVLRGLP